MALIVVRAWRCMGVKWCATFRLSANWAIHKASLLIWIGACEIWECMKSKRDAQRQQKSSRRAQFGRFDAAVRIETLQCSNYGAVYGWNQNDLNSANFNAIAAIQMQTNKHLPPPLSNNSQRREKNCHSATTKNVYSTTENKNHGRASESHVSAEISIKDSHWFL